MAGHLLQAQPSHWVTRFAPLVPAGRVLDLACGGGRHTRLFAGRGHPVLAVDRDPAALSASTPEGVNFLQFDLEREGAEHDPDWPLRPGVFAGIVVTNYLHRPLLPALLASLADQGVLIYETFAAGNGQFGKPSNPDFLLQPGELLHTVAHAIELRVLAYEDGYVSTPAPAMVQRICARRGGLVSMPEYLAL
jgi:SAM-dependent methyltransferase